MIRNICNISHISVCYPVCLEVFSVADCI